MERAKPNIATIYSSVVKAIVSRDRKQFIAKAIVEFGLMMVMWREWNGFKGMCVYWFVW